MFQRLHSTKVLGLLEMAFEKIIIQLPAPRAPMRY